MRLTIPVSLLIFSLSGCIITPFGGATVWWKTVYVQQWSNAMIKKFRDGEMIDGEYARCDSLDKEPPYTCECNIFRAFPSPGVKWTLPPNADKGASPLNNNYLATVNAEPPSFDGHPTLQYAFSDRENLVWFYDLTDKTLKSRILGAETRWKHGDRSLRAWYSSASYVHITATEIFYFAGIKRFDKPQLREQGDPDTLAPSTIYRWSGSGELKASPSPSGTRGFLVWRALIGADGVIGPLLISDKEGSLARANPALYVFVPEDQLPVFAPNSAGLTQKSCLATIRQGAICSYRQHGMDGSDSRSEPTCVPFNEKLAEKVRRSEAKK
ncbi:MAG: hypothetical protein V4754_11140 [Pseudomonadota bacterium]